MDKVILKSAAELEIMRESGRLLASVFDYLDEKITVGTSTMDINNLAEHYIVNQLGARPAVTLPNLRHLINRIKPLD